MWSLNDTYSKLYRCKVLWAVTSFIKHTYPSPVRAQHAYKNKNNNIIRDVYNTFLIGLFWDALRLCFKTRWSAIPFTCILVSIHLQIKLIFMVLPGPCFQTEALGNSEMAYDMTCSFVWQTKKLLIKGINEKQNACHLENEWVVTAILY